jgi:hypothetical protein
MLNNFTSETVGLCSDGFCMANRIACEGSVQLSCNEIFTIIHQLQNFLELDNEYIMIYNSEIY